MALSLSQTAALAQLLKPGMRVCSFGYPDIIAPLETINDILGEKCRDLDYRDDNVAICKRHGLQQREIPDAHSLFKLLGCELDVYDIVQERGCEILCDLNEPMQFVEEDDDLPLYDIVLDVGTAEHCFNIAQAIMNMAGIVKKGGYIIHENPFNWGNHGFVNINPTFFADFYEANGFTLLECGLVTRSGGHISVPLTKRFRFTGEEANIFALAQRVAIQPMVYPVQSKYAGLIPAAVVPGVLKEVVNG